MEFLTAMFKGVKYDENMGPVNNAILCAIESFLDYLDEFVYLYEKRRFTLINHCVRGAFESFLSLLTIVEHPQGFGAYGLAADA